MVVNLIYLVLNLLLHERLDRGPILVATKLLQRAGLYRLFVDLVGLAGRFTVGHGKLTVNDAQLLDLLEGAVDCSAALCLQDALLSEQIE